MKPSDLTWSVNLAARSAPSILPLCCRAGLEDVEQVNTFHRTLPGYRPTPLVRLHSLSRLFDLQRLAVKDESQRLDLGAFNVLGVSFAVARHLAGQLGCEAIPSLEALSELVRARLPRLTLVCASDGNHGHALAWTARQLGAQAVVFLPAGCPWNRYERIAGQGAQVIRTDLPCESAMELASARARERGWLLVQDGSYGDEQIPSWIMQGHLTVIHEAMAQWQAIDDGMPSHVLVQAAGSFAAAVQSYLSAHWGNDRPRLVVVEPSTAPCLLRSLRTGPTQPRDREGRSPNPQVLEILRAQADYFVACGDELAARGMRILGSPTELDPRIISGESGALGIGVLSALCMGSSWRALGRAIGLGWESRVLVFNTEGDTDANAYRRIVWDGVSGASLTRRLSEPPSEGAPRRSAGRRLLPS